MPSFRIRDCELGLPADIELGPSALKIEKLFNKYDMFTNFQICWNKLGFGSKN